MLRAYSVTLAFASRNEEFVAAVERDLAKVRVLEDFGVDLTLNFTATKDMACSVKVDSSFFNLHIRVSQISQSDQVRKYPDDALQ